MKKMITAIMTMMVMALLNGTFVLAAPETAKVVLIDGVYVTFDAEYYAANNPDVVAALGNDADVLLQHYITSGQYEGRYCCAPMKQKGTLEVLGRYAESPSQLLKVIEHKTDGLITTINFTYDSRGNMIRKESYDSKGNPIEVGLDFYEYDRHGNLIKDVSGKDGYNVIYYDGQGHRIKTENNYSSRWEILADNIYDSTGKITETISHEGRDGKHIYRTKYVYDEKGQLVNMFSGYDGEGMDYNEVYQYDDKGNLIYLGVGGYLEALPFPGYDEDVDIAGYRKYFYDETGRLIETISGGGVIISYEYDSRGNLIKESYTTTEKFKGDYPYPWSYIEYLYE